MSTTIHLAAELLSAVAGRAKDLRITRNRYIVRALERALREDTQWSPALVDEVRALHHDAGHQRVLAEMRDAIRTNRTSKGPPAL